MNNKPKNINVRSTIKGIEKLRWLAQVLGKSQSDILLDLIEREYSYMKSVMEFTGKKAQQ